MTNEKYFFLSLLVALLQSMLTLSLLLCMLTRVRNDVINLLQTSEPMKPEACIHCVSTINRVLPNAVYNSKEPEYEVMM